VHIVVRVGGVVVHDENHRTATYNDGFPIQQGQRIDVTATLLGTKVGATLGCIATVDGVPDHDPVAVQGPRPGSTAVCWAIA